MPRSCSKANWVGALLSAALLLSTSLAKAGQDDVVLLPTVVPIAASPTQLPELRRPEAEDDSSLARWARQLDAIITEAVQDLGLKLDVSVPGNVNAHLITEDGLVERAAQSWVVSPRLEFNGDKIRIRILAVPPGSRVVLVRSQEITPREVSVRALTMTRDVVQAGRRAPEEPSPEKPRERPSEDGPHVVPARSQGRAVLALNAAAFGGYVGFTLQRASGSDDDRLTYPLIALGTGIGLGGTMIVADEWDVGLGDAWYLAAGAWWPLASGFLLADGYGVEPDNRYTYGLLGATTGVALATTALTFKGMGEGGAMLAHSGGAFGLLLGGMAQLAVEGRTDVTPTKGMGYGTGAGVLVAGAAATQIHVAPSRILMIDLGAVLGGLTGAAAASPLLLGEEHTENKDRAWLASVAAGTIAGGIVAYFVTQPAPREHSEHAVEVETARPVALPYFGIVATSRGNDGAPHPIYGGGLTGAW